MERTMPMAEERTLRHATNLAWVHAALFGALAASCYVSPETVFGDSAWLALVLDAQLPIAIFAQTAALEHFEADLEIPWFIVPLVFVVLTGVTVHRLLRLKSATVSHASSSKQQAPQEVQR